MAKQAEDFSLPSNPKDRKKIKDNIHEMAGHLQFIKDRRSAIKDIAAAMKEEFQLPPKVANKMAKTVFNHDYSEVQQESATFELFYENIIEIDNTVPAATTASDEE